MLKNVADIYALTPMQELMLLHALTSGRENDVLFNQIVYELTGALDEAALQGAWQHLVDRHPVLRTIFVWQKSQNPVQVVRETTILPWKRLDWSAEDPAMWPEKLTATLEADRAEGFGMMRAPLMRITLIELSPQRFWMIWSSHHLISDRWSIGLVLDEVATAYDALARGERPFLPPAPRYREYIGWLAQQDESAAERFWRENLADLDVGSFPLSGAASGEQAHVQRTLPAETAAALRRFAVSQDLTLGVLVPAAWGIVLGAATGRADVVCGLTVSGRPSDLPGATQTVGSFINNVPLRLDMQGADTVADWLRDVQGGQLALGDFEHNSPAQIKAWSGLDAATPLFETLVVVQGAVTHAQPAGIGMEVVHGRLQTGYPLSLEAAPDGEQLTLKVTYDTGQVDETTAQELLDTVHQVLLALPERAAEPPTALRDELALKGGPTSRQPVQSAEAWLVRPEYEPPNDALENQLVDVWEAVLNVRPIGVNDNYFDLGADSQQTVALFSRIAQVLGETLPVGAIFQAPTVRELAELLRGDSEEASSSIIVPIAPAGEKAPFFCVHGGAGHVFHYRALAQHLDGERPFFGIQPAHKEGLQTLNDDVVGMAAEYVAEVRRVQPAGPYFLGGFCFGGIVAFEMAQQLRAAGEDVAFVGIIDTFSPNYTEIAHRRPDDANISWLQRHARRLGEQESAADKFSYLWRSTRGRINTSVLQPVKRKMDKRRQESRLAEQSGKEMTPELRDQLVMSATSEAYMRYKPQKYHGDLAIFRRVETNAQVREDLGWREMTSGAVSVHKVPGYHMDLLKEPSVQILAAALQASMDESAERVGAVS